MKDLKIFTLDLGSRGSIIVIAQNSKEAVKKMSVCENFLVNFSDKFGHLNLNLNKSDLETFESEVECLEIYDGLIICDTGDM